MNAHELLAKIQQHLRVPKTHRNEFGGFLYRSAADIVEAVKPLLAEHEATLTLTDKVEHLDGRWYVVATARLHTTDGDVACQAWAREEATKKGMDAAQITGSASSYARKYALNGLFAIDDTADPDTRDNSTEHVDEALVKSLSDDICRAADAESVSTICQAVKADKNISEGTRKAILAAGRQRWRELEDAKKQPA